MMTHNTLTNRLAVLPPRHMRYLRKDARGYPVPFIVLWGQDGKPRFTINDSAKVEQCMQRGLCGICGRSLNRHGNAQLVEAWFVGGARCFLHPAGGFLDPGMHRECAVYALRVCPFIAVRGYGGPNGEKVLAQKQAAATPLPSGTLIVETAHSGPAQPPVFGLGHAWGYDVVRSGYVQHIIKPRLPWLAVEWWSNSQPLTAEQWREDRENHNIVLVEPPPDPAP